MKVAHQSSINEDIKKVNTMTLRDKVNNTYEMGMEGAKPYES
jgi:hypothetical protein